MFIEKGKKKSTGKYFDKNFKGDSFFSDLLLNESIIFREISEIQQKAFNITTKEKFKWDSSRCSPNCQIQGSTILKLCETSDYDIVRAVAGFRTGFNVFRIKCPLDIRNNNSIVLGVSSKNFSLGDQDSSQDYAASNNNNNNFSCGWDFINNTSILNGKKSRDFPIDKDADYIAEEEFFMILDLYSGLLSFKIDNKVSICFAGLCEYLDVMEDENLYVTAGIYSKNSELTINHVFSKSNEMLSNLFPKCQSSLIIFTGIEIWSEMNEIIKNPKLKNLPEISQFFMKLTELYENIKDDEDKIYLFYLRLMIEFNEMKSIKNFHLTLLRKDGNNDLFSCLLILCQFIQNLSYNNSMYLTAFYQIGYIDIIKEIFELFAQDIKHNLVCKLINRKK